MSIYSRARKHIDMERVKELKEEKYIAELKKQQEIVIAEIFKLQKEKNKHYDWRTSKELTEGMTTAGLGAINYPAVGDIPLDTVPNTTISDADNLDPYQDYDEPDFAITAQEQLLGTIDASTYDTLKLSISGSFNTRTVDGSELTDTVWIGVLIDGTFAGNYLAQGIGAGTHVIPIPARFQKKNMTFGALKPYAIQGVSTPTSITNIQFQRRTPKTVFVGLDDPEANSFLRDGQTDNLSPEEKKKKLEEQLKSGKEYLNKMFGEGMPGTATEFADYEPQQSFADQARIYDQPGDIPSQIRWPRNYYPDKKAPPGPGARPSGKPIGPDLPRARKKQKTMVAHHEPQGKVIKEKKTLKDITKKNPAYYDELLCVDKKGKKFEDFAEGMTTAALIPVSLDGEPDVIQTSIPDLTISSADNLGEPVDGAVNRTKKTQAIDASKTDTITINISGSFGSKVIPNFGNDPLNDKVAVRVLTGKSFGIDQYDTLASELGNGTHTISIPKRFQKTNIIIGVSQGTAFQGGDGHQSGTVSVTAFGLKRVNSMKGVFVSLDDPDATAFIRDGVADKLSPEEKKKKLEKRLKSSKEYLNKMFGEGMPNTATTIADYETQQSFADIAASYPKRDPLDKLLKDIDDADKKIPPANDPNPPNRRGMGDRWKGAQGDSDMEIAGLRPDGTQGFNKPGDEVYDPATKKKYKLVPRKGYGYNQWVPIEKARGGDTMVAHHKLQGETIMEKNKKSFNDLTKKIPGYYDGKPAPLGFPIVEPPKMKDGMHPDLVDGKKTAKRFNRLDPISAKAMPKTGNPHIDKKVKAAAKKPK